MNLILAVLALVLLILGAISAAFDSVNLNENLVLFAGLTCWLGAHLYDWATHNQHIHHS